MKLKDVDGRVRYKNCQKYRIDWNGKSRSKYQFGVKKFLEKYWSNHVVYEEFPVYGSRMTLDFFNANRSLAIEVQGEFHTGFSEFAHGTSTQYWKQIERDRKKRIWCEQNEIHLLEIFPEDLPLNLSFFKKIGIRL